MNKELMLDVGQANELKLAFRRCSYTNADIKKLCEGDILAKVLPIIRGQAEVNIKKYVIDCDADPFLPSGWKGVEEHKKGGQLEWDPTKISLYLSKEQQNGELIGGHKLHEKLAKKPALNACVLDFLLANPELIPESWKDKYVYFWGTIYCSSGGGLYVRCLCWGDGRWDWDYRWLDRAWGGGIPAALLASI